MWGKIYKVIYVVAFLFVTGLLIYAVFLAEERDPKLISKVAVVFITYILHMFRSKNRVRKAPSKLSFYEKQYKDIVEGTFTDDKKNYRELLQVAMYYNRNQYHKAYRLIDKLLKQCKRVKDYSAVYMFRALCLADEGKNEETIQAYEKLLQYDMANSRAWSNLGLRYMELGKTKEAKDAYSNAILYDSQNAYAYNNMANFYIRTGEVEAALEYALKAIELNGAFYQPMSAAAMAYQMLGDEENAEKYCKMYGANGGDAKYLRGILASL